MARKLAASLSYQLMPTLNQMRGQYGSRSPDKSSTSVAVATRLLYHCAMFIERTYAERGTLSDDELARLRAGLVDQVRRYEYTIRNYPPDRMKKHGLPFLNQLRDKVATVDALIAARAEGTSAQT